MKKLYKRVLVSIGLAFCLSQTISTVSAQSCNWQSTSPYPSFWDSCSGRANKYSVNGYLLFKTSSSCFKYEWTVNGNRAGTGNVMSYPITANGTYRICVKVSDTCNACDTTFCGSRTITCVSSPCNWKAQKAATGYWDSCNTAKNKYSPNAYIAFSSKSCLKYQWTVNGNNAGNNSVMNYPIKANGNYSICVKVSDTCKRCDTTYCTTRTITCVKGTYCNWKDRKPANGYWDSCTGKKNKYSLNAYILFTNYYYKSCLKYQWTVNGNNAGNGDFMNYPITANGTYSVCVKVTDTCNNCDTTYCTTRTITCVNSGKCNWKGSSPYYFFKDSCNTSRSFLWGYIYFGSKSCLKYQWTVNGTNVGNTIGMNYTITKNGTYSVCVKVSDTCNNCDTIYCSIRTITCFGGTACNWKDRKPANGYWDSCTGKKNKYSLNAYILYTNYYYKSCLKYQWTVNGNNVANGDFMSYPITANGTYYVCVKVRDTCNNCDTTYCTTMTFNCVGAGSCNWKGRSPTYNFWDSCNTAKNRYSLNGHISYNNRSCLKYQWKVNGSAAGNDSFLNYKITANGKYAICVKVTDTCNKCDTTYCSSRNIPCNTAGNKMIKADNKILKVYPNPSEGIIKLDWTEGTSNYSLISATGQLIQTGILENGVNTLDLNKYSTGLYLIEVRTQNAILTGKISVQKR